MDWTIVPNKSPQRKSPNTACPVAPNLQYIIDKHPVLNISSPTPDYDNTLSSSSFNEAHSEHMLIEPTLSQTNSSPAILSVDKNKSTIGY